MEISHVKFDHRTVIEILRGLSRNDQLDAALEFFVDLFKGQDSLQLTLRKDDEVSCFSEMIELLIEYERHDEARKCLCKIEERLCVSS